MRTTVLVVAALLAFSPAVWAFETIPSGHWAALAVEDLHSEGVLIGYPDGTFRGANPATRYELAVALKRLENVVRGLAANTRVAGLAEGAKETEAVRAETIRLRNLIDTLNEAVKHNDQMDARQDKALNDLTATVLALERTVKADKVRLDDLEKLVDELKSRLAAFGPDGVKSLIQAETAPLKDQVSKLAEENSALKAEVAEQKAALNRMYLLIGAAAVLGIAVK
ncbi:MAG: S-layer homology domain-containing protein [Bacillota bacterium]|nr:S-layer homology domain-containing protein [Bacillota bacterium]